jgi:hypothetical protein
MRSRRPADLRSDDSILIFQQTPRNVTSVATRQMSARRHLIELGPDDPTEELTNQDCPRRGRGRRNYTSVSEELSKENSITLLPPTFDDLGPELCERVLARLKSHRNAKHTEGSKKLPDLIPKE